MKEKIKKEITYYIEELTKENFSSIMTSNNIIYFINGSFFIKDKRFLNYDLQNNGINGMNLKIEYDSFTYGINIEEVYDYIKSYVLEKYRLMEKIKSSTKTPKYILLNMLSEDT